MLVMPVTGPVTHDRASDGVVIIVIIVLDNHEHSYSLPSPVFPEYDNIP